MDIAFDSFIYLFIEILLQQHKYNFIMMVFKDDNGQIMIQNILKQSVFKDDEDED